MRIAIHTTRDNAETLTVKLGILPNATFSVITKWVLKGKTYVLDAKSIATDMVVDGEVLAEEAVSEAASILSNLVSAELLPLANDLKKFTTAIEAKHGRQVAILPNGDLRTVGKLKEKEEGEKTYFPIVGDKKVELISVVATDVKDATTKLRGRFLAEAVGHKKLAAQLAEWLTNDCKVEAAEDVKVDYIDIHKL